jgi:membrane-associated phospholipid phosphatase
MELSSTSNHQIRAPSRKTILLTVALWLVAIAVACWVDVPVAKWVYRARPLKATDEPPAGWIEYPGRPQVNYRREVDAGGRVWVVDPDTGERRVAHAEADRYALLKHVLRAQGNYTYIIVLAVMLAVVHPRRWRAGALVLLAGAVASFLPFVLKWSVGRTRPYRGVWSWQLDPFQRGWAGLLDNAELTFPSGDAALAFAVAAAMTYLSPRWGWAFYLTALVTAAERVLENAHHVSDVAVGGLIGALSAWMVIAAWERYVGWQQRTPSPTAAEVSSAT